MLNQCSQPRCSFVNRTSKRVPEQNRNVSKEKRDSKSYKYTSEAIIVDAHETALTEDVEFAYHVMA
jgi:hypothetical protein